VTCVPVGGVGAWSRANLDHDRDRSAAAAHGDDARGAALLRAGHRGARSPPPRPRPGAYAGMSTAPTAVQPVPRGGMGRLVGRRIVDWLPAVVVLVGGVARWELLIRALGGQAFLRPQPSARPRATWCTRPELWRAGWFTFQEALGGFLLGSGLAILVALVLARWRVLGTALLPFAIAANAIPIIAFAPITNTWFSPLNKSSKIVIAAVLCFFP